jgi:hypothetical protein
MWPNELFIRSQVILLTTLLSTSIFNSKVDPQYLQLLLFL